MPKYLYHWAILSVLFLCGSGGEPRNAIEGPRPYAGAWVDGDGDHDMLKLIDEAFRSMYSSSDMVSLSMLYKRDWDGFVEAPYWPGWWIQNSFGPSYGLMPFYGEPYRSWIRHSQGLWFDLMGDGQREGANGYVAPDGSLMDCAFLYLQGPRDEGVGDLRDRPRQTDGVFDGTVAYHEAVYRQGDGNTKEYDWYYGGAAAGIIMEAERLLVSRKPGEIEKRLPQLMRVAAFIDARRDSQSNLIKGGRSANLLAPSFGGVKRPDGGYDPAYLTELSVNYCAALDRLAELCDMMGKDEASARYRQIAGLVKNALPVLMEPGGYFIRYMEVNGVRHGVYDADAFGYFEATPNHDAVALGVTSDSQSSVIIKQLLSIKELYPHDFILPNYPAYDDLDNVTVLEHLPHGMWVDGGYWATTQGRMSIACMRVDQYDHPFTAWQNQLRYMKAFRAGSPMKDFGRSLWDDKLEKYGYNVVYDCWGVPAGVLRGLFEYRYHADGLRLRPHLPASITRYIQKHPVWFGDTEIYITVRGTGLPTMVKANGRSCPIEEDGWIALEPSGKPEMLAVEIICGNATASGAFRPSTARRDRHEALEGSLDTIGLGSARYPHVTAGAVDRFYRGLVRLGLGKAYEAAMAELIVDHLRARNSRHQQIQRGTMEMPVIPGTPPASEHAIREAYSRQAVFLTGGLMDHLTGRSYWKEDVDEAVWEVAVDAGLIGDDHPH